METFIYFLNDLTEMQETVSLQDLLRELKDIKQKIEHAEELIEGLLDSILTPEEERLLKEVQKDVAKGDLSEYVPFEKLDEALRE
ncbi:hypothetical protein DRP07_10885 [Archaeoglobales archaeon]|nr:MAG: hypothetical protein DRP07_10885 [Archaeoglobales archaeon]